jgi:hypothetical protein
MQEKRRNSVTVRSPDLHLPVHAVMSPIPRNSVSSSQPCAVTDRIAAASRVLRTPLLQPGIPGKRAIASLPDRSRVVQYYMLGLPIFAPSVAFLNAIKIMPHLFKFPVRTRAVAHERLF